MMKIPSTICLPLGREWIRYLFLSQSQLQVPVIRTGTEKELLLTEPACFSLTHSHYAELAQKENRCGSSGCSADFLAQLSKKIFYIPHSQMHGITNI